jgi:SsrA-binding protein
MTRIATNRNAHHLYFLSEQTEAGIQLTGTEVKSLRVGRCHLKDSFASFEKGELSLYNMHIAQYEMGNINNHEPTRRRKLLLHKAQLKRLFGLLTQKGLTLVPLSLFFKHGIVKVEIALAKSKKLHDRRDSIKKKEVQREVNRALRNRSK